MCQCFANKPLDAFLYPLYGKNCTCALFADDFGNQVDVSGTRRLVTTDASSSSSVQSSAPRRPSCYMRNIYSRPRESPTSVNDKKSWGKSGWQGRRAAITAIGGDLVQRRIIKDLVSCARYVGSESIFKCVHYSLICRWTCHTDEHSKDPAYRRARGRRSCDLMALYGSAHIQPVGALVRVWESQALNAQLTFHR